MLEDNDNSYNLVCVAYGPSSVLLLTLIAFAQFSDNYFIEAMLSALAHALETTEAASEFAHARMRIPWTST